MAALLACAAGSNSRDPAVVRDGLVSVLGVRVLRADDAVRTHDGRTPVDGAAGVLDDPCRTSAASAEKGLHEPTTFR